MADANPPNNPLVGKQPGEGDNAAKNAEIAAKQAAQDASGHSTAAGDTTDTSSALDALAAKVSAPPAPAATELVKPVVEPPKTDTTTTPPAVTPKPEDEAAKKKADDIFKDVPQLPAGASPKSAEAFATIKVRAAQEISAREQEIEKLKTQVTEFEKAKGRPTPEQEAAERELAELREWRAKLDVDYDPKFKEHDKGIDAAREFVYSQLKKHSAIVTPAVLEEIKKYGGPDNTDLSKVFEAVKDPVLQRLVEAKLADIEMLKYQKEQAITAAKSNVGEWTKKRQDEWQQQAVAHTVTTKATLDPMLSNLEWFKEKQIAADADEATKAKATDHNKFVTELKGQINDCIRDDSPQMRAILVAGMAQLFNLQREHAGAKAELDSAKKELAAVTEKYERVRSASVSRLRESGAPAGDVPAAPKAPGFNIHPGDALDAIAKQVMEQRAAAANQ